MAHQLPEVPEPNQQDVFTDKISHPVSKSRGWFSNNPWLLCYTSLTHGKIELCDGGLLDGVALQPLRVGLGDVDDDVVPPGDVVDALGGLGKVDPDAGVRAPLQPVLRAAAVLKCVHKTLDRATNRLQ